MKAIILAAGMATRMPNKLLLPLKNGKPMVTSAIDSAKGVDITVVVSPRSVLLDVLPTLYEGLTFIESPADGVPAAIKRGLGTCEQAYVACGDNYFEAPICEMAPCSVEIRKIKPWQAVHLTGWDGKQYVKQCKDWAVAGWFHVGRDMSYDFTETLDFFNANGMMPVKRDTEWWDLGTMDTYSRYWACQ